MKKIAENYSLPYFTITPTFSVCPVHGYISGAHKFCPHEHSEEQLESYGIEVAAGDADNKNGMKVAI